MEKPYERMIIFIDARNLLGGQEEFSNIVPKYQFGYSEMLAHFSKDFHIIRGYYYDGAPHESQQSGGKKDFFNWLRHLGITLRLKEIDFSSPKPSQKGVDIFLTSDMISLAYENAYDIAVIVSGDGDYVALIELVKSKGKKVWVVSFKSSLSDKLRKCADKVLVIDNMHEVFMKK